MRERWLCGKGSVGDVPIRQGPSFLDRRNYGDFDFHPRVLIPLAQATECATKWAGAACPGGGKGGACQAFPRCVRQGPATGLRAPSRSTATPPAPSRRLFPLPPSSRARGSRARLQRALLLLIVSWPSGGPPWRNGNWGSLLPILLTGAGKWANTQTLRYEVRNADAELPVEARGFAGENL